MNTPRANGLKIVAPINSPADVETLHAAGASELYCGVLPRAWTDRYGYSDMLNKRQGIVANLPDYDRLAAIQEKASRLNMPVALTLNTSYTEDMLPMVLEIVDRWAGLGGDAIMVSDLTLLLALQKKYPQVRRHLSILANSFNSQVLQFFKRFDIGRVVLPRELGVAEIKAIADRSEGLEFEVMALNDKCRFIDGQCYFYHSTSFQTDQRTAIPYTLRDGRAEIYSYDPGYAGHGCSIIFEETNLKPVGKEVVLPGNPGCAACFIADLCQAGIGYFKLGGRGLPIQKNVQNVSFMRRVIDLTVSGAFKPAEIQSLYRKTFGQPCTPTSCYYAEWSQGG